LKKSGAKNFNIRKDKKISRTKKFFNKETRLRVSVKSFEGVRGNFFKSFPEKNLFQKFPQKKSF